MLDDGYSGFVARDGSFNVHHVPIGTYVLNVLGSKLHYPPVRVDVGNTGTCTLIYLTKLTLFIIGAVRARKLNILTLKDKELVPYPLELEPVAKTPYFQKVLHFYLNLF